MGSCFSYAINIWISKQLTRITIHNPSSRKRGDTQTARNINISNVFSITAKTLTGLYMWVTWRVS